MDRIPVEAGFVEIADRCWLARFEPLDVNVGLVGGERGLLMVDTHSSEADATRVVEAARRLRAGPVVAVVNTHDHFDHVGGNATVSTAYDGPLMLAHESMAGHLLEPTRPFSSVAAVDLGDRVVELVHPGRGHTAGDVVVRVGDAGVLYAGDLIEESMLRSGVPDFGDDCFPLEWPATLDLVAELLDDASIVVPGHGQPVDKEFVREQRHAIGVVAETISELARRGVPELEALAAGQWPYPAEELGHAVARGYAQLPRSARSLPMA
jgi:glyoxylase-like metal-dependent hydrolase (beta-lactamase superfamily II)